MVVRGDLHVKVRGGAPGVLHERLFCDAGARLPQCRKDLAPDGACERRGHGVADLLVLVQRRPRKEERVREALGARALADADDAVLVRVQHAPLLPHRLGARHRRVEVAVHVQSSIQSLPVTMSLRCPFENGVNKTQCENEASNVVCM